jgi:hypothetical protein
MRRVGDELRDRLRRAPIDTRGVRQFLDGLSEAERVAAIRSLGRAAQHDLFEAVAGFLPLSLADLVPASAADLVEVRHRGVNSLPVCTHFEKRFCRPRGADAQRPGMLFGFNHQRLACLTGPGYFVATEDAARGEVRIDYTRVPEERPVGWPEIRDNNSRLARLVYGNLVDTLRRVSNHVTIGSAARNGRDLNSWFILCRQI